jgi:hypothetical protein
MFVIVFANSRPSLALIHFKRTLPSGMPKPPKIVLRIAMRRRAL